MSDRTARRLAWSAFALWVVFLVASVTFELAKGGQGAAGPGSDVGFLLLVSPFAVVAVLILARHPRHPIGWILMAIGLTFTEPTAAYGEFALSRGLPGGLVSVAITAPLWALPVGLMGTVLLLRFPDGRLLSPRWRKVERLAIFAISMTVLTILVAPTDMGDVGYPQLRNPLGIEALGPVTDVLLGVILLIPVAVVASAASLVVRFRRSTQTERLQLKWLVTAGSIVAVVYLVAMPASLGSDWFGPNTPTSVKVLQNLATFSFALIPTSIGFAILKHRLYDIDVVINKALVYGALAAFITSVYVGVVVGLGSLIGTGGEPNLALSITATALIALAFQPVRERVHHLANRLVYGKRATPYEVLSEFAGRVGGSYALDDVLPRMARAIAQGTGAERAEVLLGAGGDLHPAAVWPEEAAQGAPDVVVPVIHRGQELGALAVRKPKGERLSPAEEGLVRDLAGQAGLVLRNVRLLEDLRASRQRLVAAQDEERRRIERNIHDGAQQQLVALAVNLRLARSLAEKDPRKAAEILERLQDDSQQALEDLRDLARGIYPPLLADKGLRAALEAQSRKSPVPVEVHPNGVGRYPAEAEAAVYFCVLEALQNAAKYAEATKVEVRLEPADDELRFEVTDDGRGFDPATTTPGTGLQNMRDRVEALGGSLSISSSLGEGTTLTGSIPTGRAA
ncbi:MAG TPA: GAF domain-containing sensor histidine kinase [Actinomycetota bacterium]|nr:GAF domain-containing sensor histidine kinase [Actinomycetota bacterium]